MREFLEFLYERYKRRYQERAKKNAIVFSSLDTNLNWLTVKLVILIPLTCILPIAILGANLFRSELINISLLTRVVIYFGITFILFILATIGMVKSVVKHDVASGIN